jgi:5-methylcytosine-specific restriction protein A
MTRVAPPSGEYVAGRAVPEWIGANASTPIPKRVKDRIWMREGGRCYLTGRKINALKDAFQFEHVTPVGLDGSGNRESNIRLALTEPHAAKSKKDNARIDKADRTRQKHLGIWPPPKRKLQGRGFDRRGQP